MISVEQLKIVKISNITKYGAVFNLQRIENSENMKILQYLV